MFNPIPHHLRQLLTVHYSAFSLANDMNPDQMVFLEEFFEKVDFDKTGVDPNPRLPMKPADQGLHQDFS